VAFTKYLGEGIANSLDFWDGGIASGLEVFGHKKYPLDSLGQNGEEHFI